MQQVFEKQLQISSLFADMEKGGYWNGDRVCLDSSDVHRPGFLTAEYLASGNTGMLLLH
jgi:hypothetical protein